MPTRRRTSIAFARASFFEYLTCARSPSAICQPTGKTGLSANEGSWNTIAASRPRTSPSRAPVSVTTSCVLPPSLLVNSTAPRVVAVSGSRPRMLRAVTVLPLPLSPTIASTWPASTDRLTPLTASTVPASVAKLTDRLSMSTTSVIARLRPRSAPRSTASVASAVAPLLGRWRSLRCSLPVGSRHLPAMLARPSPSRCSSPVLLPGRRVQQDGVAAALLDRELAGAPLGGGRLVGAAGVLVHAHRRGHLDQQVLGGAVLSGALQLTGPLGAERLVHDLVVQLEDGVHQHLRPRRAAGQVHVHRDDVVDALHHRVVVEHAAGAGADAHGEHPARLGHLVVDLPQDRRHLLAHPAGDDHQVGLPRRGAEDLHAEAGEVVAAGARGHHLDRAAGQPERRRPQRGLAGPVDQLLDGGQEEAAGQLLFQSHG